MQVSSVGSPSVVAPTTYPSQKPAAPTSAAPQQDEVILSQKAKDFAAKMAGKSAEEELKESPAAKAAEKLTS